MTAPLPVPALPDTERRTSYTIASQTGPFNVSFALYGDGSDYGNWIEVWLNGVKLTAVTGWSLSSPSGSLGLLARPITDATITLATAGTGTLQIVGARRPRRLAQFNENQGVAARDLNQAVTDLETQAREFWDAQKNRVLSLLPGESNPAFPVATARANKLMYFDGSGIPTFTPLTITGTLGAISLGQTRSQIPSITVPYNTIMVSGYAAAGDLGAGAVYTSVGAGAGSLLAIQDAAGTWFRLVTAAGINVGWFGAKGDGATDDTAAINAALAATISKVFFPSGTYKYTATLTPASGQEIYGEGYSTLFQGAANCKGFTLTGLSNVVLRDFKIDGAKGTFATNSNDGIYVDWTTVAGSNIKISNVIIRNCAGCGVLALAAVGTPSSDFWVENCDIQEIGSQGINSQDYISNVWYIGNRVKNNGLIVADRPGIDGGRNGSNLTISNNICIGSGAALGTSCHGISVDTATNATVTGNFCTGWIGYGIEVGASTNVSVSGNTCTSNTRPGITISGDANTSAKCQNVSITGNVCTGNLIGIYAFTDNPTGSFFHQRVTIAGNTCDGNVDEGINVGNVDGCAITGNTSYGNTLTGIYANDCINIFIDGNTVYNNNCASIKAVTSATEAAGTVTVTTTANHGYSTNDVVTVWGANPAGYNGAPTITVTGLATFTYAAVAGLTSPAVGVIKCSKPNSTAAAGVKVLFTNVTSKNLWRVGSNFVFGNGFRDFYDVTINGFTGVINEALYLKETNTPTLANLTSGESANILDRGCIFVKNGKLAIAYNLAGTVNYLIATLDGATATLTQTTTAP